MKIEETENNIQITIKKNENYNLQELKQQLINLLYENVGKLNLYEKEIELLEILLKQKD